MHNEQNGFVEKKGHEQTAEKRKSIYRIDVKSITGNNSTYNI